MGEEKKGFSSRCKELSELARELLMVAVKQNAPRAAQYFLDAWMGAECGAAHLKTSMEAEYVKSCVGKTEEENG